MTYSIMDISRHPRAYIRTIDTRRAAQIGAKLLGERFPSAAFSYDYGPALCRPDAAPAMRDSATSFEVERLIRDELSAERCDNPLDLPKWLAFRFEDGISAYLEHDRDVVARCRHDPSLVEIIEIFAERPTTDYILSLFAEARDAA